MIICETVNNDFYLDTSDARMPCMICPHTPLTKRFMLVVHVAIHAKSIVIEKIPRILFGLLDRAAVSG